MASGDIQSAELRLDSANADDLARLHPWLDAASRHLPDRTRHAMQVALEEAVMNIAMHGFAPGESGEIVVTPRACHDGLTLVVEDTGRVFDPTCAPTHARPANLLDTEPGGLGLTLLRHYCADIDYQCIDGRNRLTLRFPSSAA